jgi:hypothetical protein
MIDRCAHGKPTHRQSSLAATINKSEEVADSRMLWHAMKLLVELVVMF